MKQHRDWLWILLAWLASYAAAAIVFPDLLIFTRQNFCHAHDPEAAFLNVFALINQWTHGGISLYDRPDQINIIYTQLTSGMYTVVNMLVALIYVALSPWITEPGQAYYAIYSVGFHALTMLLRVIGGYLILRRFKLGTPVTILTLVLLNTVLSVAMYFGLLTNNLYSYLPLMMYLIWVAVEDGCFKHLLAAIVLMSIAIANSAEYALGYFYQVVHFFIISAVVYGVITRRWRSWLTVKEACKANRAWVVGAIIIAVLIMVPWVWMAKFLTKDFFIAGSGLSGTEGRISNGLNPLKYFGSAGQYMVGLKDFPLEIINFNANRWEGGWPYVGITAVVMALTGIIAWANPAKWLFVSTAVLILLSNAPLVMNSPLSLAHWVNALANPFHFLLHSFHMSTFLLPFVLMPLVGLGLQWWFNFFHRTHRGLRIGAGIVLAAMFVFECGALRHYVSLYHSPAKDIKPRIRFALNRFEPLIVEYQNPLLLNWNQHYRFLPNPTDPPLQSSQNLYGLFYHYTPLERYLYLEPNIYNPLPMTYKNMYADKAGPYQMAEYYLSRDTQVMFLAQAAISDPKARVPIFAAGLERKVVMIDAPASTKGLLPRLEAFQPLKQSTQPEPMKEFTFDFKQSHCLTAGEIQRCAFVLPKEFPLYEATTVLPLTGAVGI